MAEPGKSLPLASLAAGSRAWARRRRGPAPTFIDAGLDATRPAPWACGTRHEAWTYSPEPRSAWQVVRLPDDPAAPQPKPRAPGRPAPAIPPPSPDVQTVTFSPAFLRLHARGGRQ